MSASSGIGNTDRINFLNIALMLGSALVALYVPFELFLFSYAVLGPLHYLTEISWLHGRNYFTRGQRDFWFLGLLTALIVVVQLWPGGQGTWQGTVSGVAVFVAFFGSLVLVVTRRERTRFIALMAVLLLAVMTSWMRLFLVVFLPTLVHVYLLTGLFMLYGALKTRSRSGYLTFAIFLLCPLLFLILTPHIPPPNPKAAQAYLRFAFVNVELLSFADRSVVWDANPLKIMRPVFLSAQGLVVMRFIAFAYTYHYLNWFSKTSIIQWHHISKTRLAALLGFWLASVGLFLYDYSLGFTVLFGLGLLHVILELPLNHTSILGIFRQLRTRWVERRARGVKETASSGYQEAL